MVRVEDIQEVADSLGKKKKKTTDNETWKRFERTVASDFGTTRTPLSGMVKTITNSDTLHKKIYIECKYRSDEYNFWENFEEQRAKYPESIIVLCLHPKNRPLVHVYYSKDFFKRINSPENSSIRLICEKKYSGVGTLFAQTIERSAIEDKLPVVAIKKKSVTGKQYNNYLIGIDPKNFVELRKILNRDARRDGDYHARRRRDSIS